MFVLINNVFLSFGEGAFFYSMGIRLDASTIETLNSLKGIGGNVYNGTLGIMSLMAPFFIGMALAEERKVDSLAAGLLSVAAFMTVTPYSVGEAYAVGANWLGGANIISGIIIGLAVAEMFTFVVRRNWVIKLPDSVPTSVSRSFSALIPGFLILSIMGIIAWALNTWGTNFHQIIMDSISTPLASLGSVVGWAYVIFVPLLWFFGIHGSLALTALDSGIMTPWALENISIYQQFGSVDAALDATFAAAKHIEGPVAGHANVLIFPDLNSGNIAFKLIQLLAGANTFGQIITGLSRPAAEVSRGASAHDVFGAAAVVGCQAIDRRLLHATL